jgi:hypothetical protein
MDWTVVSLSETAIVVAFGLFIRDLSEVFIITSMASSSLLSLVLSL